MQENIQENMLSSWALRAPRVCYAVNTCIILHYNNVYYMSCAYIRKHYVKSTTAVFQGDVSLKLYTRAPGVLKYRWFRITRLLMYLKTSRNPKKCSCTIQFRKVAIIFMKKMMMRILSFRYLTKTPVILLLKNLTQIDMKLKYPRFLSVFRKLKVQTFLCSYWSISANTLTWN